MLLIICSIALAIAFLIISNLIWNHNEGMSIFYMFVAVGLGIGAFFATNQYINDQYHERVKELYPFIEDITDEAFGSSYIEFTDKYGRACSAEKTSRDRLVFGHCEEIGQFEDLEES